MEPEIQQKIEQTVLQLLKTADMEEMTEFKLRVSASERLRIDLTSVESRKFIRGVVESFLLSTMEPPTTEQEDEAIPSSKEFDSEGNLVICKLSNKRNVVIQDYKGKSYVSIREYYFKNGMQLPSTKGIHLSAEQWSSLRKSVPLIEEAIMKMQSKLRTNLHCEQSERISIATASTPCELNEPISNLATASHADLNGQASNLIDTPTPHELNGQVPESLMTTSSAPNRQVSDSALASIIHGLVPIEINRFDGKNYQFWAPIMELFLKQLNIAYVLSDPCPSVATRPEASAEEIAQTKAAEQKWSNDDYLCRRNILVCLSDALFNRYSNKTKSAKELWDELRLVYLYEEFGHKRSLVKKYIEFQIVDERPIVEQVQEINSIADSVVGVGIFFDEKFHVSTIISKLPPSRKDFCMRLMCEEELPFRKLMDLIKAEEEFRTQANRVEPSSSVCFNHSKNLGPRVTDKFKPRFNGKRRDTDTDYRVSVCYFCGRKGHLSRNCRTKKFDKESSSTDAVMEMKTEHS